MLDLIEPVRVTKNTSPDLLDGEGSSTNGSTSGRYVDRLPITGYYKRQRLRTTHQLRSNRRLCRPTARIFAHSKSERRVRRWRSAYSCNKGEDYGPSREINSALADENVGGDDSANADNSAHRDPVRPTTRSRPGRHSNPGEPRFRTYLTRSKIVLYVARLRERPTSLSKVPHLRDAGGKQICSWRSINVERDDLGMTSANVIRSVRREVDITAAANKAAVAAGGLQSLKATL